MVVLEKWMVIKGNLKWKWKWKENEMNRQKWKRKMKDQNGKMIK